MTTNDRSAALSASPAHRAPRAKLLRRAAFAVALVALSTCENIDNIDVDIDGKAVISQATIVDKLLGTIDFGGFNEIDFSQQFKNQGVTKGDVDSVHFKSMTLTIASPATGSFDFVESLEFFAEASGLPKISVASLTSVPAGARTLELNVDTEAELEPYVVAPSMRISSKVKGSRPDQETTVDAHAVLDVDVHVPGCN